MLKAGSTVLTFPQYSSYLFENVTKISHYLSEEDSKEALSAYLTAFIERFTQLIVNHSNDSANAEQFTVLQKKLTFLEKELFNERKRQLNKFQAWKN
mmetsp:Transcript_27557/g.20698  ORF Transcript_27557/g.20698 Transcript_27557/m.20698 type:complete len:97 (+) Transcript_27557:334-624(+)